MGFCLSICKRAIEGEGEGEDGEQQPATTGPQEPTSPDRTRDHMAGGGGGGRKPGHGGGKPSNGGGKPTNGNPQAQQHAATSGSGGPPPNPHATVTRARVRNVTDGDTLTLDDERRVRLAGIDAPEIKERQALAAESKALLKALCDRNDVELEVDARQPADKYGRVVARVWVRRAGGERVCANDAMLGAGLAKFYQAGAELHARDWMLGLQADARRAKRGVWAAFDDAAEAYTTRAGGSFHRADCEHIKSSRLTKRKLSECLDAGMSACRTCQP